MLAVLVAGCEQVPVAITADISLMRSDVCRAGGAMRDNEAERGRCERASSVCGNRGYGGVVVRMGDVVETEGKIQRSASGGNCLAATSPSVVNTAS